MKTLALAVLLSAGLQAQTVQIVIKQGAAEKAWSISLRAKTTLSAFTCVASELEPGESTDCTVTLNQPARVPVTVTVVLPTGFTGPASVTIPAGAAAATFQIGRADVTAGNPTLFPTTWSVQWEGGPVEYYSEILTACCARADRCGLPDSEIAWEPCAG